MKNFLEWFIGKQVAPGLESAGLALARIATGLMLATYHGWHKLVDGMAWSSGKVGEWHFLEEVVAAGFPLPVPSAWLATAAQLGGGLMLAAGAFTRPVATVLVGTLLGAFYTTIVLHKDSQPALLYLLLIFIQLVLGPGHYSVDRLRASSSTS